MDRGGHLRQLIGVSHVVWRIAQSSDMHRRDLSQGLQDIPAPDLVAPVRRKRNTVGEKQDFARHPSPREIKGPIRLASQRGNFCHAAT